MKHRNLILRGMLALGALLTALTLIFPQIGWLEWISMIPLCFAAVVICSDPSVHLRTVYRYGFFTVYCFYFVLYHWFVRLYPLDFVGLDGGAAIAVIALAWLGLPILHAVVGGFLFLLFALMHRSPVFSRAFLLRPFAFAALWTVFEWCGTQTFAGVPWGRLALGQVKMLPMLGIASWFGSYAVAFLIVAVNALLAEILLSHSRALVCGSLAAVLLLSNLTFGLIWKGTSEIGKTVCGAVIQGNISSYEKWGDESVRKTQESYRELSLQAAKEGVELIVWPETTFPYDLNRSDSLRDFVTDVATECRVPILVGALFRDAENREYNALYLVLPDGTISENYYAKRHLVPFGEYVPARDLIMTLVPPLANLSALNDELTPGTAPAILTVPLKGGDLRVGSLICFDSIYEILALESAREDIGLMVISSNDSWFYDSAAVYQHEAQAQLRAIETGKPILRSANTGISAIISAKGENLQTVAPLMDGYAVGEVTVTNETTLYTKVGNLAVWICMAAILILTVCGLPPIRKRKS